MATPGREAVHSEPVWRDRSNFIIAAEVLGGGDTRTEQLWARQVDEHRFEVCCIPFFVYDVALGDVVVTSPKGDRKYTSWRRCSSPRVATDIAGALRRLRLSI